MRRKYLISIISILALIFSCSTNKHKMGPLSVQPGNPRYFADGNGNAVYLTGSHTWANCQDMMKEGNLKPFNYDEYLRAIKNYNHNFFRLWAWENTGWLPGSKDKIIIEPLPYKRTGPGEALDGGLKFDVTMFNEKYFTRLKKRVSAAQELGIYTAVMLFEGWSIEIKNRTVGNPYDGHPFHRDNNINGIDGDTDNDGMGKEIHTLQISEITRLQESYIKKVVDELNDFDNIIWEISNESHRDSDKWHYHVISFIKKYEAEHKLKQHPVLMTVEWEDGDNSKNNADLFNSPADAVSPNPGDNDYRNNPSDADGRKVVIVDTDHIAGIGGNYTWVWKNFLRGYNFLFMDPWEPWLGRDDSDKAENINRRDYPQWEAIRKNMGYTLAYAEKINLDKIKPRNDLSSTGFCLAVPGSEYLVYQPEKNSPFTIKLEPDTYSYEWFDPVSGNIKRTGQIKPDGADITFKVNFPEGSVIYLKSAD
ncbi:DUF6298 domain-containing protein [candidate division KSB1 bacterium]